MDAGDRTRLVPKHQGRNILPNLPLFSRLLRFAHCDKSIAIRDKAAGFIASYVQLLTDVLHLRNALRDSLDKLTLAQLEDGAEVFINILGPGGYEHTVAFFAVIAVGAVVVPLCKLQSTVGSFSRRLWEYTLIGP
jgi:malonyl-CoA/methylmalonyl-CoA synthetase